MHRTIFLTTPIVYVYLRLCKFTSETRIFYKTNQLIQTTNSNTNYNQLIHQMNIDAVTNIIKIVLWYSSKCVEYKPIQALQSRIIDLRI